jgi:thioredoxin reductase (NADPH)
MHELIIIGAGPAGLSAAIYAQRFKINTLIISEDTGGTANTAHKVDNYPGLSGLSGFELLMKFKEHAEMLGAKIIIDSVKKIEKINDSFRITTKDKEYESKSIIIATGTKRKKLNVKGEEEFFGKGVSYCAVCDGFFFKGKDVCIIGNDTHAVQAGIVLSPLAKKVYMINDKKEYNSEPVFIETLNKMNNIEIIKNMNVKEIFGENKVKGIQLSDDNKIECEGVFIEIGSVPGKALISDLNIDCDEQGHIKVNEKMETNIKGVFAAGDITTGSMRWYQIVTAASEGALCVKSAFSYIKEK